MDNKRSDFNQAIALAYEQALCSGIAEEAIRKAFEGFRESRALGGDGVPSVYLQSDHAAMLDMFIRAEQRWSALCLVTEELVTRVVQMEAALLGRGIPLPKRPGHPEGGQGVVAANG